MCIGACGKRGDFFVTHVNPIDGAVSAQRIRKAVERVAWEAIDALDSGISQTFYQIILRSSLPYALRILEVFESISPD